jgi:hypothetical protein
VPRVAPIGASSNAAKAGADFARWLGTYTATWRPVSDIVDAL